MFLAYTATADTKQILADCGAEPDTELVIKFDVTLSLETYSCRVRAQIVRITEHGIGVKFGSRTPWQLTMLIKLLTQITEDVELANSGTQFTSNR